jgi:hypothetical protein
MQVKVDATRCVFRFDLKDFPDEELSEAEMRVLQPMMKEFPAEKAEVEPVGPPAPPAEKAAAST